MGASSWGIDDALAWLAGHVDYERTAPTRRDVPTLAPIVDALASLGDPHLDVAYVHVTGTNGKGSTTALCAALLTEAGLRVGTFTSPDLHAVNERITVAGTPIGDVELAALLARMRDMERATSIVLTRFELLTVAALVHLADEGVDVGVIEVGVGGTWDSTNVIDGAVAVITNVSLDHTEILGDTVAEIASDKAGIAKEGATVIVGDPVPDTRELIERVARSRGAAAVWQRDRELFVDDDALAVGGRVVTLTTPHGTHRDVLLALHGSHQAANALCALAAAEAFVGTRVDDPIVAAAFDSVRMPGRLEVLSTSPLLIVDGAHNPAGMVVLARALAEGFAVTGRMRCVVGVLGKRDPVQLLEPLAAIGIDEVYCCEPDSPRARPASDVAAAALSLSMRAHVVPRVADALDAARDASAPDDAIVVTGSLYVVGEARAHALGLGSHRG